MRNKYRLAFQKVGALCFLGHLDLQKVFQRAVKRSKLPVSYSNGFNPHQQMSFALPLPLGMEGLCEYIDIELDIQIDTDEIIDRLNHSLPEGIKIIHAKLMEEGEKSSAALIIRAVYDTVLPYDENLKSRLDELISNILKHEEIVVTKRTKGGIKESDIRKDIFDITNKSSDESIALEMILSAGSMSNLKADVVIDYIYKKAEIEYNPFETRYVRKELLMQR